MSNKYTLSVVESVDGEEKIAGSARVETTSGGKEIVVVSFNEDAQHAPDSVYSFVTKEDGGQ